MNEQDRRDIFHSFNLLFSFLSLLLRNHISLCMWSHVSNSNSNIFIRKYEAHKVIYFNIECIFFFDSFCFLFIIWHSLIISLYNLITTHLSSFHTNVYKYIYINLFYVFIALSYKREISLNLIIAIKFIRFIANCFRSVH